MVAALVACHWWFGSVIGMPSRNGQYRPWGTTSERPFALGGKGGEIADVNFLPKEEGAAVEDYLDMLDEEEKDEGQSVDAWRT